jgi:hypothetical protein|tara:strand:+ start:1298 stop:1441 length:144 start_codon:yes stop_codon:yes gene_type:complete
MMTVLISLILMGKGLPSIPIWMKHKVCSIQQNQNGVELSVLLVESEQ